MPLLSQRGYGSFCVRIVHIVPCCVRARAARLPNAMHAHWPNSLAHAAGDTNGNGHGGNGNGVTSKQHAAPAAAAQPQTQQQPQSQQLQGALKALQATLFRAPPLAPPAPPAVQVVASAAAAVEPPLEARPAAVSKALAAIARAAAAQEARQQHSAAAPRAEGPSPKRQRQLQQQQQRKANREEAERQRGATEFAEAAEALTSLRDSGGSPRAHSGLPGLPAGSGMLTRAAAAAVAKGIRLPPESFTAGSADTHHAYQRGVHSAQGTPFSPLSALVQQSTQQATQQHTSPPPAMGGRDSPPPLPASSSALQAQQAQQMLPPFSGMMPQFGEPARLLFGPCCSAWGLLCCRLTAWPAQLRLHRCR